MGIRSFIKRRVKEAIAPPSGAEPSAPVERSTVPLPSGLDQDGFQAVLHAGALSPGTGRTVVAADHAIALFFVNGAYFAIDDACTHEDAPLGEGEMEDNIVICPYHDWRYDVTTGECLTDETRPVGCFATKLAQGFVWVGPRTTAGTTERGGAHADGLVVTEVLR
jgi:nitrite reductase (NADH) small subunit